MKLLYLKRNRISKIDPGICSYVAIKGNNEYITASPYIMTGQFIWPDSIERIL